MEFHPEFKSDMKILGDAAKKAKEGVKNYWKKLTGEDGFNSKSSDVLPDNTGGKAADDAVKAKKEKVRDIEHEQKEINQQKKKKLEEIEELKKQKKVTGCNRRRRRRLTTTKCEFDIEIEKLENEI